MKNTFGNNVTLTLFGESHGQAVGAVLDGMAPGVPVDEEYIAKKLSQRSGLPEVSTARREPDSFRIVSGVFEGKTTGTPVCIIIENKNTKSNDYQRGPARPGHADYTAFVKYHGYEDYRGGGHFSGRLTAPVVAAGAVAMQALKERGILICTHIKSCGGISDRAFGDIPEDFIRLENSAYPVLDEAVGEQMRELTAAAAADGDSIGGILETAVYGPEAGLGEPFFDSVESLISHAVFSIPAVKGIEFGAGFSFGKMHGNEANDPIAYDGSDVITRTNNNGGINGGITNGMPIIFSTAVKPTPSIFKEQETVDFIKKTDEKLSLKGRHDPAIFHRAAPVISAVTALVICDLLSMRYGNDFLQKRQ